MRYYLAADASSALPTGACRRAWASYRTAERLLRDTRAAKARGGLMLLSFGSTAPGWDALANDVLRECLARDYGGVVLDWEQRSESLVRLSGLLDQLLTPYRLRLYVPEAYSACAPHATILVSTAVVGGSVKNCLADAVRRYGAQRIALDLERLSLDFILPMDTGRLRHLTPAELRTVTNTQSSYFSQELCARYCAYCCGCESHYVLFDDACTLRRKSALAESLAIQEAFLMLPEMADIAPAFFAPECAPPPK